MHPQVTFLNPGDTFAWEQQRFEVYRIAPGIHPGYFATGKQLAVQRQYAAVEVLRLAGVNARPLPREIAVPAYLCLSLSPQLQAAVGQTGLAELLGMEELPHLLAGATQQLGEGADLLRSLKDILSTGAAQWLGSSSEASRMPQQQQQQQHGGEGLQPASPHLHSLERPPLTLQVAYSSSSSSCSSKTSSSCGRNCSSSCSSRATGPLPSWIWMHHPTTQQQQ
jgi:hypothetical protein